MSLTKTPQAAWCGGVTEPRNLIKATSHYCLWSRRVSDLTRRGNRFLKSYHNYIPRLTSEHVFLISGDVSANLQLNTPTVKSVQIHIYYTSLVTSEHEVTFRRSKCRFMIFLRPLTEKNEDFRLRKSTSIRAAGITLLSRECVTARYHTAKPYITFCEAEYITLLSRFCSRPA